MIQEILHQKICDNLRIAGDWFIHKVKDRAFPVYSSFDIRDSGFKVAPVDGNIFPAGFNNICEVDREAAAQLFSKYLQNHYPSIKPVLGLMAEEHTQNPYYWQNVYALRDMLIRSGHEVHVIWPRQGKFEELGKDSIEVQAVNGQIMAVEKFDLADNRILASGKKIDLVICNNDFSGETYRSMEGILTPLNPPIELGWYRRRKVDFFNNYNILAEEFAELLGVDADILKINTIRFDGFDMNSPESRQELADVVDEFLKSLAGTYEKQKINHKPFAFIKNNAGTYGLGVTKVSSGADVINWNNRTRTKMKAAKGGGGFTEVIVQEGIPTRFVEQGVTAEPTIYMVGGQLAGGFLRTHTKKGPEDNLNSPGAVFKRLCVSDLKVDACGCPMENVYGWTAKLGLLAIAEEVNKAKIQFIDYLI